MRASLCSLHSSDSLRIVLAGAVSATEPTYIVKQIGGNGAPIDAVGVTTGGTAVTMMTGESPPKIVDSITIVNRDSASVTVTVNKRVSGTDYPLVYQMVLASKSVMYISSEGIDVVDVNGQTNAVAQTNSFLTNLDLGASGTAGTLDIFPSTAASGKLAVSVTDQTGDTTVGLVIGAMAAARTITLADPLANADILTGKMAAVARTATADGTTTGTIADAGLLQHVTVTSDDANKIIVLPTPTPGRIVILHNGATGYELRSSDPATIAINGGTGAGAESAIAANSTCVMICVTSTAWKGFFLDADSDLAKVEVAA